MKKALIVGGANGIGLSIATCLAKRDDIVTVNILDKAKMSEEFMNPKFRCFQFDLTQENYDIFDKFQDVDTLMITAGFGKLSLFKNVTEKHIVDSFNVNTIPVLRIIKHFYEKIEKEDNFYCGVMVSIAGFMSSPFFSVYAATKAALKVFIESVNVELVKANSKNKILNVSPGSLKGTSFAGGQTDLSLTTPISYEIIRRLESKEDLYIPQFDEIFKDVLERYHQDFRKEGLHSYEYKENNRLNQTL
mgnify:CR=1 FL=1